MKNQRYSIANLSDEPIYSVALLVSSRRGAFAGSKDVLLPGEDLSLDQESDAKELVAAFRDNSDKYWVRYVHAHVDRFKIRH